MPHSLQLFMVFIGQNSLMNPISLQVGFEFSFPPSFPIKDKKKIRLPYYLQGFEFRYLDLGWITKESPVFAAI